MEERSVSKGESISAASMVGKDVLVTRPERALLIGDEVAGALSENLRFNHERVMGGAVVDSVRAGDILGVEQALSAGGSTEEYHNNERTCLMSAAYGSFDDIVRVLIAAHANLDALDTNRRTALHYAIGVALRLFSTNSLTQAQMCLWVVRMSWATLFATAVLTSPHRS